MELNKMEHRVCGQIEFPEAKSGRSQETGPGRMAELERPQGPNEYVEIGAGAGLAPQQVGQMHALHTGVCT